MMSLVEFFSQPVWHRLGLTLVHFLWQGMAVAVIACTAVRVLQLKRGNPRYTAYLLAFAVMAVCPPITFMALRAPAKPAAIAAGAGPQIAWGGPVPRSLLLESGQGPKEDPVTPAPLPHVPLREKLDGVLQISLPWVLICWMSGVFILSVRLLLGSIGIHRWRRNLEPLTDELSARIRVLSERLGMPGFSRVFVSRQTMEAVAMGYLRPMVLLPAALVTRMPPEMLEAIIAHELAHIRRFDLWVNLAQRVVETLLFYHPAVWWLSSRLRSERELCCDELAVQATGERLTYASTLESVGRARLAARQPALAVGLGQGKKPTLGRVRHVLGLPPTPPDSRSWLAGAIAVALLAILAVPIALVLTAGAEEKPIAWSTDNGQESGQPRPAPPALNSNLAFTNLRESISGTWLLYMTPQGDTEKGPDPIDIRNAGSHVSFLIWQQDYEIPVSGNIHGGDLQLSGDSVYYGNPISFFASARVAADIIAGTYSYSGSYVETGTFRAVKGEGKKAKGWVRVVNAEWEYSLDFYVWDLILDEISITSVTVSGPHIGSLTLPTRNGEQTSVSLGGNRPVAGDTYTYNIGYSDGTSETVTAPVRDTVVDFPIPLSPGQGDVVDTVTPTFSWAPPSKGTPRVLQSMGRGGLWRRRLVDISAEGGHFRCVQQ